MWKGGKGFVPIFRVKNDREFAKKKKDPFFSSHSFLFQKIHFFFFPPLATHSLYSSIASPTLTKRAEDPFLFSSHSFLFQKSIFFPPPDFLLHYILSTPLPLPPSPPSLSTMRESLLFFLICAVLCDSTTTLPVTVEAEDGVVVFPMQIGTWVGNRSGDAVTYAGTDRMDCSGKKNAGDDERGHVKVVFEVEEDDFVRITPRIRTPDLTSNSFSAVFDDEASETRTWLTSTLRTFAADVFTPFSLRTSGFANNAIISPEESTPFHCSPLNRVLRWTLFGLRLRRHRDLMDHKGVVLVDAALKVVR